LGQRDDASSTQKARREKENGPSSERGKRG